MKFYTLITNLTVASCLCFTAQSWAMGSKKSTPPANTPTTPVDTTIQAKPIRFVSLAKATVPAFYFPNGVRVDFNADLDSIIETELNSTSYFRSQISTPENSPRLVVSGGVTTLELDITQLNIKIGWNPAGPIKIGIPPVASGEVDVKLSALSMDFKVYDKVTGQTYMAAYTDKNIANISISARINLSNVQGSLDAFYKTKVSDAIRKASKDIFTKLQGSASFNQLPWETKISGVDQAANIIFVPVGSTAGLAKNQAYSVYSACSEMEKNSGCFERFLADVKISTVGVQSAEAKPLSTSDSIVNIEQGDKVLVKVLK